MNWNGISKAFAAMLSIGNGFAKAKEDGDVSVAEICAIGADVCKVWADSEGKAPVISRKELIEAYLSAGWGITMDNEE